MRKSVNKVTILTLVLLLLSATILPGQTAFTRSGYFKATLTFTDGSTKTCFVAAPRNSGQSNIYTRASKEGKDQKVSSASLVSIVMQIADSTFYYFDHMGLAMDPGKKVCKPRWLFAEVKGYASLYRLVDGIVVNKYGDAVTNGSTNSSYSSTILYYMAKENENVAYLLGGISPSIMVCNINHSLKKSLITLLHEDTDLVKKIETGEIDRKDLEDIFTIYNDFMKERNEEMRK
jgi:hypothetical protein